jgi:phosphoribosylamine-glycine ligase
LKEGCFSPLYASSVRFTVPPYPAELKRGIDPEKFSPNEGIPILGWEKYKNDIYFYEIRKDNEKLVHSSGTGVVGLTLGQSEYVKSSFKKPYKILDKIHVPDMQYRTDLDTVLTKMVKEIGQYA